MKKLYTLTISLILILRLANAQVPQGFKYQTAIRDNNGAVLANKLVAIKLSLLTGSASGTAIYSEVHKVATNDFGVANLNVGNGTASLGIFNTIDWGSNTFFLKTEVDVNNGTNYTFMGSSQLLSVPFAMYAAKSANAADDKDKDTTNEIQNINLNNNTLQLNKNGGSVDLTKYDKDSQQLVLSGNILSITKGNSIVLNGAVDLDADPTNELQNLSLNKDTLKLSQANFVVLPKDNDADSTNEIQSLSVIQNKLTISKSNQVNIDADTTNEIQSFSLNQNKLSLTKSNEVFIDADTTNEIQNISYINDSLRISKNSDLAIIPSYQTVQSSKLLYGIASGINNINLTLSNAITGYSAGMIVNFRAVSTNTSSVTVNINGFGNKAVFKNISTVLDSNDIRVGQMVSIIYDGVNFQFLVSPYANTANSAIKLNNDTTGGLVPKGTMIVSNTGDAIKGFTFEEEIRSNPFIEKLAYYNTCPSAVYGDSIYYSDKVFSLKTNLFSNKKITNFASSNSVMINGKIYYLTNTGNISTSINNIATYDPVVDTIIYKNAFLPAPGITSVLDFQVFKSIDAIYILRTTNNVSLNQTVGKLYKYNYILDTVILLNTQTISTNSCQLKMAQSKNDFYIITVCPPSQTINSFVKLSNDIVSTLAIPFPICYSGCRNEFYGSDDYILFGNYYYDPLINVWNSNYTWPENLSFFGVLNNKSYYIGGNYDVYEMDLKKPSVISPSRILSHYESINNGNFGVNKDKLFYCGNSNSINYLSASKKKYLFKKD
jgi:hypothetical protein